MATAQRVVEQTALHAVEEDIAVTAAIAAAIVVMDLALALAHILPIPRRAGAASADRAEAQSRVGRELVRPWCTRLLK